MNAYLIARLDMTSADAASTYKKYVDEASAAYKEHGARFLVRGGPMQALEGPARSRNVVIEYPTLEAARACYDSTIYQAARKHRLAVAEGEIVIVQGAVKDRPAPNGKKGYWISRSDVHDAALYKRYVETGASAFEEFGAVFLARGGPHQPLEGQGRDRNVLIEFPSTKHAVDCFNSDTYRKALDFRHRASTGDVVVVEGV